MQQQVVTSVDKWLKAGMRADQIQNIVRERSLKLSTTTRRVLYNKTYGGFGFSAELKRVQGLTEDCDVEEYRSSRKSFETIERLGHGICTLPFHLVCPSRSQTLQRILADPQKDLM